MSVFFHYLFLQISIESKNLVQEEKGFLNTHKRAFPSTDKRVGEDVTFF
jgi:hypothetical protein